MKKINSCLPYFFAMLWVFSLIDAKSIASIVTPPHIANAKKPKSNKTTCLGCIYSIATEIPTYKNIILKVSKNR